MSPVLRVFVASCMGVVFFNLASCSVFPGDILTKSRCVDALKQRLKDPDSYREDSPIKLVQEVKGNPKVFGWFFNARNSFGGYGPPSEALCYSDKNQIVLATFDGEESAQGRRDFLSSVNPDLRRKIANENSIAEAQAAKEREKRIRILKQRCESRRADFEKGYGSGYLCSQYFVDGTFMESDIEDVQYTDEYLRSTR